MGLGELKRLKREMEGFKDNASLALESALERREKEVGDGETYHRMIQVCLLVLLFFFLLSLLRCFL